jgi:hypothetical protein
MRSLLEGCRELNLKNAARGADFAAMPRRDDLTCPICQADVPLAGDEKPGDEVCCLYCGAPCRLVGKGDEDDLDLEEDF